MVFNTYLNNNSEYMDSYKLLDITGSESENDIIQLDSTSVAPPPTKKKRLKRKERDLLRSSGTLQIESPSRINRYSVYCPSEVPKQLCGLLSIFNPETLEFFRSIILIASVIGLTLVTWLALHLQFRLDATQATIANLEASGSELPAKFHESHVRLQQLEKNHSSLWTSLATITNDLSEVTEKLNKLEGSVKLLQESLSGSPQLTSLPKDVANIQDSVATFGSTLQDVQSAIKALKEEQSSLHKRIDVTETTVTTMKDDVMQLYNSTHLPPTRSREGQGEVNSIAVAFLSLKNQVSDLNSSVASVNASVASKFLKLDSDGSKVQNIEILYNSSIVDFTKKLNDVQLMCSQLERENLPLHIANISLDVSILKESSDRHYKLLQNITQNVAVVKGVEKKLEGSQLQLASGVSELKQQLQTFEQRLSTLTPPPTTPVSSETLRIRTREIHVQNLDTEIHSKPENGIVP